MAVEALEKVEGGRIMREILFKGKRKDNGEWVEGSLTYYKEFNGFAQIEYLHKWEDGEFTIVRKDVDPETVCQYTGLKDSKDNKVFEGDIVKYADRLDYERYMESLENPEKDEECNYSDIFTVDEVIYGDFYSYPAFDLDHHDFECNALSELNNGNWHYETIGNIFDNPELLGVTE